MARPKKARRPSNSKYPKAEGHSDDLVSTLRRLLAENPRCFHVRRRFQLNRKVGFAKTGQLTFKRLDRHWCGLWAARPTKLSAVDISEVAFSYTFLDMNTIWRDLQRCANASSTHILRRQRPAVAWSWAWEESWALWKLKELRIRWQWIHWILNYTCLLKSFNRKLP